MSKSAKGLRFAPLIRVSTESQAKQGESLKVQRDYIEKSVEQLGGIVEEGAWKEYGGQEHATIGQERKKFDRLLEDAGKRLFDAVIVADASRWSRDNRRSKEGLEILQKNGVRFFIGSSEFDLWSPQASLFLGMSTEMNEFFGKEQSRKSILSRIERAKQGKPSCGKLPFGRKWDEIKGWSLDEKKAQQLRWAAKEYLAGNMNMVQISKSLDMNQSNLWKIMCFRSGANWEVSFVKPDLGISEIINIEVPRILEDSVIDQIRAKSCLNKTYCRGDRKHQYLLSGFIFCSKCGYVLQGQTNRNSSHYYRHPAKNSRKVECDVQAWVRADIIEEIVMAELFKLYGDPVGLENAILRAIPDHDELRAMEDQLADCEKELVKVRKEIDQLVQMRLDGEISKDDLARTKAPKIEREAGLKAQLALLRPRLSSLPSEKAIRHKSRMAQKVMASALKAVHGSSEHLETMSWKNRRLLLEKVFCGVDADGRKLGVLVSFDEKAKSWAYEIRGGLEHIAGWLPKKSVDAYELVVEDEMSKNEIDIIEDFPSDRADSASH
jgi:DNA invertase Pin-like site-specific DNA recombinase